MLFRNPWCVQLVFVYFRFLFPPFLIISGRAQQASPAPSKIVIKLMHWTQAATLNKESLIARVQQTSPAPPTAYEKKGRDWRLGLSSQPKSLAFQLEIHIEQNPKVTISSLSAWVYKIVPPFLYVILGASASISSLVDRAFTPACNTTFSVLAVAFGKFPF